MHASRYCESWRKAGGKTETLADDRHFLQFLEIYIANEAHKARDLDGAAGNTL